MAISAEAANQAVETLASLPFFPTEAPARAMIADLLRRLVEQPRGLHWLIRTVLDCWRKWEGPMELRALYCSRFKPLDGKTAYSAAFPNGYSREQLGIAAGSSDALAIGAASERGLLPMPEDVKASMDNRLEKAFQIMAKCQQRRDVSWDGPATAEEIAAAPAWLRKLEGFED